MTAIRDFIITAIVLSILGYALLAGFERQSAIDAEHNARYAAQNAELLLKAKQEENP